ncbi:MAG: hypothetical protein Q9195_005907 [Heterodermia aff. obscurata]
MFKSYAKGLRSQTTSTHLRKYDYDKYGIIFVHGLFGDPYKTWASKSPKTRSKSPRNRPINYTESSRQREGGVGGTEHRSVDRHRGDGTPLDGYAESAMFWPQDMLPGVIADVRVFTWGYDADVDGLGSRSQSTINQHAGSLLSDIADQREVADYYKRPIVFVAHSLGGIIVKSALNRSSGEQGTRLKDIAPATSGICFLGTPHRGSKSASLGKIAYQTTVAATRRPNTKLLQGLERNSAELELIGDSFAQTLLKYGGGLHIYSFREEKETRKYFVFNTMIVEADSAKMEMAVKRSTETRILEVRAAYNTTFSWLYDPEVVSFSNWLRKGDTQHQPIFWIQGKPGSGKSTLMKFAMGDSRTRELPGADSQPSWTFVAFFFHDRGSTVQKSLRGMLQEIVHSMLRQLPQLVPYVITQFKQLRKTQRTRAPSWSLDSLTTIMFSIIEQRDIQLRMLLFLDALDEHEGDNDRLVQLVKDLGQRADSHYVTLKICLASRPWNVFQQNFGNGPNFAIDHYTKNDIRIYTESRLLTARGAAITPESSPNVTSLAQQVILGDLTPLANQIIDKAQGVFIWVRLVTDQLAKDIQDGTPYQKLIRRVAEMPEELEALYEKILTRIDPAYADSAHVMFQLTLCTSEPLPLTTLVKATEYSVDKYLHDNSSYSWKDIANESSSYWLRWLISRSGGLLEAYDKSISYDSSTEQCVQFLHQTAKDYVQSTRARRVMNSLAHSALAEKNGFYFLTLSCQSRFDWVHPIRKYMFDYAKMAEVQDQVDNRIHLPILRPGLPGIPGRMNNWDLSSWWFQFKNTELLFELSTKYFDSNLPLAGDEVERLHIECLELAIMVAANLIFMVDLGRISHEVSELLLKPDSKPIPFVTCLLQLAIGGPSIAPRDLEDRATMVQKISALSYIGHIIQRPHFFTHVQDKTEIDCSKAMSPMIYLLAHRGILGLNDDARLSIAKALLQHGEKMYQRVPTRIESIPLVCFCVQNESASFLRLMLEYGGSLAQRNDRGWKPLDYAILRQDKSILAVFEDVQCSNIDPDWDKNIDPTDNVFQSLILPSNAALASIGHAPLALLLSRRTHQNYL